MVKATKAAVSRPDAVSRAFGDRVRTLRERSSMTLEQLSQRSGVSKAMLSKVERGEKSPTIGIATRIAHAVDATLSVLISGQEQGGAVVLVRRDQRHVFRDGETGFERHLLSPAIAGNSVEVLYHRLPSQTSTGKLPPYPQGTEKHIVVQEGELVVAIGQSDSVLKDGDALFFEADVEHSFDNRTDGACGYYLVISRRT
jgi:transcriptional regulator with XRE-family HTH domain